jgi:hypothetical protein
MRSERRFSGALKIAAFIIAALGLASAGYGQSQGVVENFNGVTGSPGATVLEGGGFYRVDNWDDGITGEEAFAGGTGYARLHPAEAFGSTTDGVGGTGAGVLRVSNINFNMLDENFGGVTGTGGGVFLAGGSTPDTFGYTTSWDNGIYAEGAFAGTFGGAILVGGASAVGMTTGGYGDDTGMGRIDVANINLGTGGSWYGGLQFSVVGGFPGAAILANAGFEDGVRGSKGAPGWNAYGNMYTEGILPHSGTLEAKFFGTFPGNSGIYQRLPAQAGQTWEMDGYGRTGPSDSISGTGNQLVFRIEFFNAAGTVIGTQQQVIVTGTSPLGSWIHVTPALQATAPAGTVEARPVIEFVQSASQGGSAFADDITFRVVAGTPPVDLSQFVMTARVKGTADATGEVVGDIQFRIEDPQGNRLIRNGTATTAWTQIGGALSTFTEADPNGVPATNVFNPNADHYAVVLAFSNDGTTPWGTGGTLDIDDLYLTNSNSSGSIWYAGLAWPDLMLAQTDLTKLQLRADVKGSTAGGTFELRVEGFKNRQAGLDEKFDKMTGVGGGVFLAPADVPPGGAPGVVESGVGNWDDGIVGEAAFGGLFGYAEFFDPDNGGISAQAVTDPIQGKCGELRVACVSAPPSGGWYAGLTWAGQILPSTDLSTVVLQAKVRGMAETVCGGGLGTYELRIEDAQGDRLYFPMTADGNWQTVGGPLSTAVEGPRLGGGGDGHFNLDSPTYTVVLSFTDPMVVGTWEFGGVLRVDDLYMTPANVSSEIGRVSFRDTIDAAGTFQSVGGLLSQGVSNFGGLNEGFSSATGTGGGEFYLLHGGGTQGGFQWDDGIPGEQCFAGIWGSGSIAGGVWADACTTCGMGGGKAGELRVEGAAVGTSGGWWAGLDWPAIRLDLSAGIGDHLAALAGISLTANAKGIAGVSGLLGKYELRIEDADGDCIGFVVTSNGSFQSVGGPLSTATRYNGGAGNNSFNYNQGAYTVTLVMTGGSGTGANPWGSGGTVVIDDLFLTGATFGSADSYQVILAFEDGVPTWGTSGTLTMDNLLFGPLAVLGDMDCSGAVNIADISPFVQALIDPAGYAAAHPGCDPLNGDFTGNGGLDGRDIQGFVQKLIAG